MHKARAKFLREWCHDEYIRTGQAVRDGKKIPHLNNLEEIYKVLEEIVTHIEKDLECPAKPG